MQPLFIGSFNTQGGMRTDKKPFALPNQAFSRLENAWVYRDRVIKRLGLKILGRLRRVLTNDSIGNSSVSPWSFNIYTLLSITGEPDAQIAPGTVVINFATPIVFTDQGDGTLTSVTPGNSGTINYINGNITLIHTAGAGVAVTITVNYYPALPSMGITTREISNINDEQTLFYDTKYVYTFSGGGFQEFIGTVTWTGSNSQFFWASNYRGTNPQDRLYFVTNFNTLDPMRYTDGTTWTTFAPAISSTDTLYQARILLPYYGRLIALNVWEGTTMGGSPTANIFNRCRFSQLGNPVASDAWRQDIFGRGGFIDAPTNEAIVSAAFIKNTLLVEFERSTWQLRYVGEYGLPFIWERISSDFGAESTFSTVLFDDGILAVGDKAIVVGNSNTVRRIDEQIPNTVFEIQNANQGPQRVQGVRDFFKECVYWCYPDSTTSGDGDESRVYPNRVLLYNYSNNTFAEFDDRVTSFGTFQSDSNITWDSLSTFWDDENVFWDDDPELQSRFPAVVSGNQQGYIHFYNATTVEEPSLFITAIDTSVSPNLITVPNHNLISTTETLESIQPGDEGNTIKISGTIWNGTNPGIDGDIYAFLVQSPPNQDQLALYYWDGVQYVETPVAASGTYIGGGELTVYPQMFIQSKDFNPYIDQNINLKLIYADFLLNYSPDGEIAVELYVNATDSVKGNLIVGQKELEQYLPSPYYTPNSDYAWHRLSAVINGQFVRVVVTYNDDQMSNENILQTDFQMNAMMLWVRPGGIVIF